MPRTNKHYASKREDLLNKVWSVFLTNGYQDTTIALIIKELDISKGVFYHYFNSKKECAQAAVDLYSDMLADKIIQKCRDQNFEQISPEQKLTVLFEQGKRLFAENTLVLEGINSPANKVFHEMLMVSLTKKFSLLYADVIRAGIKSGCFHTEYPMELAEMMLALSNFYLDADFFGWDNNDLAIKIHAYKELISKGLGIDVQKIF